MMHNYSNSQVNNTLFFGTSILSVLCVLMAFLNSTPYPILIPILAIFTFVYVLDVRFIYYLLIGLLAVSTEIHLSNGFSTDIPSEPLMWLMTGTYFLLIIQSPKESWIPLRNMVSISILFHLFWIGMTTLHAANQLVAIKYFLAKIWYVVPFFFLPFLLLKDEKSIRKALKYLFVFLCIGVTFVFCKHAFYGFRFNTIEKAVQPIFRNHVNYAAIIVIVLPYLWIALFWKNKSTLYRRFIIAMNIFMPIAIYFSYTRAAIGSMVVGLAAFLIIHFRLTKIAILSAIIAVGMLINYLIENNNYLEYAPEYETTISYRDFNSVISATAKGQDLSTMERVYRWVAGANMIKERPLLGFGPNNFYPIYKDYTVNRFRTYVSDNPQKSGIHNYYLMIAVEQGVPGLLIFVGMLICTLLYAERYYHQMESYFYKYLIAAAYSSFIIVLTILVVNDLIEADKVGPFFFLAMAFITMGKHWKAVGKMAKK